MIRKTAETQGRRGLLFYSKEKTMNREEYNRISKIILDSCITVHKEMVPGLSQRDDFVT